MNQLYDLEINILSCLLQKPELMKNLKLEDKHFIRNQRLWQFMKAFYKKYETFDVVMMFNVCKNKYKIIEYLKYLIEVEPIPNNFEKYQQQLIELYNEKESESILIKNIYELSNDLLNMNIEVDEFVKKVNNMYERIKKEYENN